MPEKRVQVIHYVPPGRQRTICGWRITGARPSSLTADSSLVTCRNCVRKPGFPKQPADPQEPEKAAVTVREGQWVLTHFYGAVPEGQAIVSTDEREIAANLMKTFGFIAIDGLTIVASPKRPGMPETCEHHWVNRHEPGHLIYWLRQCGICHEVDLKDLDDHVRNYAAEQAILLLQPPPRHEGQKKLLPFPWVFASRKLARRLIEHIESCHRIMRYQLEHPPQP